MAQALIGDPLVTDGRHRREVMVLQIAGQVLTQDALYRIRVRQADVHDAVEAIWSGQGRI